ncbi:MAG: type II CAAX endopeptidase family protein, partial [Candidatus Babeliales bacterium]
MQLFRSPFFWVSATIVSTFFIFFGFYYFPKAFPIVHIDLTMNRSQALQQAAVVAEKNKLDPTGYQQAASFVTDEPTKTFVELEAGGKNAFVQMMEQHLYEPYTWRIRHFKEFEKNETSIYFTPSGQPYGFVETISENKPGANITSSEAQSIAEKNAAQYWQINFNDYKLVETAKEELTSGRGDHTFVYERPNQKIGEGYYRLSLGVSGDKLASLVHWVKIPEAFTRRYQEMRSTNNTIAWAGSLAMFLFYLIGGCVIGLFFLYRQGWVIWRTPLFWAISLACLLVLAQLNQLPLAWMHYNTAHTMNTFLLRQFTAMVYSFISLASFLLLIFMSAESLTRKAFGQHLQFWKVWSTSIASSYTVLGRTIGGYLLVSIDFAFVILFYLLTTRYLGWWVPSSALFDPNILATYFPWFSPLVNSLNAGFIEECLFRAVPLAGAALLGKKFGKRNYWIIAAFILQAIVFSAAHANYPMQPAYARLVELIVPSFTFGGIYLAFGLLPAIIAHFIYDVIWFSIPIFISSAPGALINKSFIIFFALTPLWVVLRARLKIGHWTTIVKNNLNKYWQPSPLPQKKTELFFKEKKIIVSSAKKLFIFGCGVAGLVTWLMTSQFTSDAFPLTLTRDQAITQAKENLKEKGINLSISWQPLTGVFSNYENNILLELQHRFIWEKGGKENYQKLLNTYLMSPYWIIRFAQFQGDIVERAEEYRLLLQNTNRVFRTLHTLPQTKPGAQLTEEQALTIAQKTIKKQLNLNPTILKKISATAEQQPNRKDWAFIFSDAHNYPLSTGQARIYVVVSGNKVTDLNRYIHVPEEWERNEQNNQNRIAIIKMLCSLFLIIFSSIASWIVIRYWHPFISRKAFLLFFSSFLILFLGNIFNGWPTTIFYFNTTAPFLSQLFQT